MKLKIKETIYRLTQKKYIDVDETALQNIDKFITKTTKEIKINETQKSITVPVYNIDLINAREWIKELGFSKYWYNKKVFEYCLIKNNVVEIVSINTIIDIVTKYIYVYADHNIKNKNLILTAYNKSFSKLFMPINFEAFLPSIDKNYFLQDTHNTSYFYFRNGLVEISKNKQIFRLYQDIDKYIWKDKLIEFDYNSNFSNGNEGVFEKFCKNICTNKKKNLFDAERFNTLQCVIGYLLHSYRDDSNKAIILSEANTAEGSNGGTGKSLILKAINFLKNVVTINTANQGDEKYLFSEVQSGITDIIFFDECPKRFKLNNYFSIITGSININEKYGKKITIQGKDTPKLVFATNYAITTVDASTKRRIFEFELMPFYDDKHTPYKDFKALFWSKDWTQEDWQDFYIFMLWCNRTYFDNDCKLPEYNSTTARIKKVANYSCIEFAEFMQDKLEKCNYDLSIKTFDLYNEFIQLYPEFNYVTNNRFTYWIKQYCNVFNLEYSKFLIRDGVDIYQVYKIKNCQNIDN